MKNLKSLSRSEKDDEPIAVDLKELVDESFQLMQKVISNEKVQLDLKLPDDEKIMILGHAGQIQQVLMNLITNAADAVEENVTPKVEVILTADPECAYLSVKDNGVGISKEHQEKIFDPFFTTKPVDKGTGLGLSVTRSIVQNHNAQLVLHSEVGQGTEFKIKWQKLS